MAPVEHITDEPDGLAGVYAREPTHSRRRALGAGDSLDRALASLARANGDQNKRDDRALHDAVTPGFPAGLIGWRGYVACVLQRLTFAMRQQTGRRDRRDPHALTDHSLQFAPRREGLRAEATGHPDSRRSPGSGQALTKVGHENGAVAALARHGALAEHEEFGLTVAARVLTAAGHHGFAATVEHVLRELDESATRLLADVDHERRRIERDLHDGPQQRLVALGIKLELTREQLAASGAAGSATLQALVAEVDEILEEIRMFGRGERPSLLADRGLPDALRSAALRSALPAKVDAHNVGRYPDEIETAVYFTCLEALQNAVKHARAATRVWITLRENGAVRFDVRDDGAGFAEATANRGSGLTNMRDRLAEVGGTVTIQAAHGRGTRVVGTVPLGTPVGPLDDL
jgi:signal transduction histidine kinase